MLLFEDQRRMYLPGDRLRHRNIFRFRNLVNTKEIPVLFKFGKFCKEILSTFKLTYSTSNTRKNESVQNSRYFFLSLHNLLCNLQASYLRILLAS